jgi:hypothetical protein
MHAVNISSKNLDAPLQTTPRRKTDRNRKGKTEQDRLCTYNVKLWRVRLGIVTV